MAAKKETTIQKEISRGSQSIDYLEVVKIGSEKIKINIKSDSYRQQCYARAYTFVNKKWEQVAYIPSSKMKTEEKLFYHGNGRGEKESNFTADRAELIRITKALLS